MPDMLSKALPVFESVTVCGGVVKFMFSWPNVRLVGERLMVVAGATPVPVKLTVCGLPLALSVMVSDALRDPAAVGVNVALIVQLAPAPTLLPQLFVCAKSPGFAPPIAMLEMLSEALPMLESVTICAALVELALCWPNVRLAGCRLTTGADGGGELPPPPPPPQATQIPTTNNAVARSKSAERRRALAKLVSVARASKPAKSHGQPTGRRRLGGTLRCWAGGVALAWAVVVMVSVVVTGEDPVTLTGVSVQDIPGPAPGKLHPMATVPMNPFRGVTVIVEVADCPGAEMLIVVGFADTLKSVTLIVAGAEVEFT